MLVKTAVRVLLFELPLLELTIVEQIPVSRRLGRDAEAIFSYAEFCPG